MLMIPFIISQVDRSNEQRHLIGVSHSLIARIPPFVHHSNHLFYYNFNRTENFIICKHLLQHSIISSKGDDLMKHMKNLAIKFISILAVLFMISAYL